MKPAIVSLVRPMTGTCIVVGQLHKDYPFEIWTDAGSIDAPDFLPLGGTVTDFFNDPMFAGITHSISFRPRFAS